MTPGPGPLPRVQKVCAHPKCENTWEALPSDRKKFCGRSCANSFNATGLVRSDFIKKQISWRMKGNTNGQGNKKRASENTK